MTVPFRKKTKQNPQKTPTLKSLHQLFQDSVYIKHGIIKVSLSN